ncbi:MAG: 3-deoxy-manno-octulosonate cytidylyltransferase [Gammaproteobacteria bacterium]|nr:3-deoxy-manno-octulosonate cytidylyltransferase [Gammaproteobacteria bacterium]
MKDFHVVVPARLGSKRLPGKPLLDLGGKSMIVRVAERALLSNATSVTVATDDQRIVEAVGELPVKAVVTSPDHPSGTDRVHEIAELMNWDEQTVVVNVQGDEPLIPPRVIDQVANLLLTNHKSAVSTLAEPISTTGDIFDPNVVKVVSDSNGMALYFSRAPVPWHRERFPAGVERIDPSMWSRHVGIYAYRVWALNAFVKLHRSELERTESLEQLRFLENGYSIAVENACGDIPIGVDTESDLIKVRQLLENDSS